MTKHLLASGLVLCLVSVLRGELLKEGEVPPAWELSGVDPLQKVKNDSKIAVVMFLNSSCRYSQSQAIKLFQWSQRLAG